MKTLQAETLCMSLTATLLFCEENSQYFRSLASAVNLTQLGPSAALG